MTEAGSGWLGHHKEIVESGRRSGLAVSPFEGVALERLNMAIVSHRTMEYQHSGVDG